MQQKYLTNTPRSNTANNIKERKKKKITFGHDDGTKTDFFGDTFSLHMQVSSE